MPPNKNCKDSCNNLFLPTNYSGKEHCRDTEHSIIYRENGKNLFYDKRNEQTKYFCEPNALEKSINISKLRNILTEAISNVTKEKTLKKGESVELTLEIELLKTESNTPTNSLLEVTILQHNKRDNKDKRKTIQTNPNKMTIKDEIKRSSSESVSLKRKNWFRKVEKYREYKKCDLSDEEIMYFDVSNNYMKTDCNHRENFVTVLPDKLFKNGNFKRGCSTMTQKENDSNIFLKCPKPKYTTTITTTDNSLVKKLSNLFLPTKKEKQFTDANTDKAMKALKYGLNNIKHKSEKNVAIITSKEENKEHINNLKNQVSNIYVDMIEYSDSEDQSEQHKCYVDHNMNTNKKHAQMSKNTKAVKNITASFSDTCIEYHTEKSLNLGPNYSNSINYFKVRNKSLEEAKHFMNNNMEDTSQNYNKKIKSKKSLQQSQKKNGRGDAIDHYKQSQNKLVRYKEQSKPFHKNKSKIFWNGKTIEINKEIKKKIEMLVLNELQNVALKEGMECEVTPLPSTEESMNSVRKVEKMSSYMCKLDIRDAKIRKSLRKRKLLDRKYKTKHERQRISKFKPIKSKSKPESNNRDQPIIECLDNADSELFTNSFVVNHCERYNKERSLGFNNKVQDTKQYAEMKYLKYSSSESYNARLKSAFESEMKVKPIPANNIIAERQNNSDERFFAKGFVKKIESNDSTWYAFLSGKNLSEEKSQECKTEIYSNKVEYSSVTSKECENKVEIELTTQDLEFLLKEARDKHKASKIFIYKECNNCINGKYKKSKMFTGKNSNSYTKLLLTKASKKLEKYAK